MEKSTVKVMDTNEEDTCPLAYLETILLTLFALPWYVHQGLLKGQK